MPTNESPSTKIPDLITIPLLSVLIGTPQQESSLVSMSEMPMLSVTAFGGVFGLSDGVTGTRDGGLVFKWVEDAFCIVKSTFKIWMN